MSLLDVAPKKFHDQLLVDGGIPLHEAMISHGMFPFIVFMLFANMAIIILAINCAAITFIIDFGGNFRARRMLTIFDKTSRPTMTEPT
jgi:hypothetical protein